MKHSHGSAGGGSTTATTGGGRKPVSDKEREKAFDRLRANHARVLREMKAAERGRYRVEHGLHTEDYDLSPGSGVKRLGAGAFGVTFRVPLRKPRVLEPGQEPAHFVVLRLEAVDRYFQVNDKGHVAYRYTHFAEAFSELRTRGLPFVAKVFDAYYCTGNQSMEGAPDYDGDENDDDALALNQQFVRRLREMLPFNEKEDAGFLRRISMDPDDPSGDAFAARPFMVVEMEWMEHGDMASWLAKQQKPIGMDLWRRWMFILSYTVATVQSELYALHFDIKPENILLRAFSPSDKHSRGYTLRKGGREWIIPFEEGEPVPVLADFGVATTVFSASKFVEGDITEYVRHGSRLYAPPYACLFGDVQLDWDKARPQQKVRRPGYDWDIWSLSNIALHTLLRHTAVDQKQKKVEAEHYTITTGMVMRHMQLAKQLRKQVKPIVDDIDRIRIAPEVMAVNQIPSRYERKHDDHHAHDPAMVMSVEVSLFLSHAVTQMALKGSWLPQPEDFKIFEREGTYCQLARRLLADPQNTKTLWKDVHALARVFNQRFGGPDETQPEREFLSRLFHWMPDNRLYFGEPRFIKDNFLLPPRLDGALRHPVFEEYREKHEFEEEDDEDEPEEEEVFLAAHAPAKQRYLESLKPPAEVVCAFDERDFGPHLAAARTDDGRFGVYNTQRQDWHCQHRFVSHEELVKHAEKRYCHPLL